MFNVFKLIIVTVCFENLIRDPIPATSLEPFVINKVLPILNKSFSSKVESARIIRSNEKEWT